MKTRLSVEEQKLTGLFAEVVRRARVFQGGGNESTVATLAGAVQSAASNSFVRLFPKFTVADHADWGKVIQKARDGAPDSLTALGYTGGVLQQPVCKEVFSAVNAVGVRGADLQKRFAVPPYGWPKDAITGAILALLASGNVRATLENKDLNGPKELPQTQIGKAVFYKEDEPPTIAQRLAVRSLLTKVGVKFENGQEGAQIPALIEHLRQLAKQCGGPAPLPEPPTADFLDQFDGLGGNQRFCAVANRQAELSAALNQWVVTVARRDQRLQQWNEFERLLQHAAGLPQAAAAQQAASAVSAERRLLDDPDPINPHFVDLAAALKKTLTTRAEEFNAAVVSARAELEARDDWSKLSEVQRSNVLAGSLLEPTDPPDVSSTATLLTALDHVSLDSWHERASFLPSRLAQVKVKAAQLLEPESVQVKLPTATIKTAQDLEAYLTSVRAAIQAELDASHTVIV